MGREVLDTKAHNVKFYLYQLSEIYVRLFTLLYTFRYRFQFLISQKVDKIRPPDQHVSDQQHEKEKSQAEFHSHYCCFFPTLSGIKRSQVR